MWLKRAITQAGVSCPPIYQLSGSRGLSRSPASKRGNTPLALQHRAAPRKGCLFSLAHLPCASCWLPAVLHHPGRTCAGDSGGPLLLTAPVPTAPSAPRPIGSVSATPPRQLQQAAAITTSGTASPGSLLTSPPATTPTAPPTDPSYNAGDGSWPVLVGQVTYGFPRAPDQGCPRPNPATLFTDLRAPRLNLWLRRVMQAQDAPAPGAGPGIPAVTVQLRGGGPSDLTQSVGTGGAAVLPGPGAAGTATAAVSAQAKGPAGEVLEGDGSADEGGDVDPAAADVWGWAWPWQHGGGAGGPAAAGDGAGEQRPSSQAAPGGVGQYDDYWPEGELMGSEYAVGPYASG